MQTTKNTIEETMITFDTNPGRFDGAEPTNFKLIDLRRTTDIV